MFCKYCGKQINVNDKFCPYCGKSNSSNVKTITIDTNLTADSLRKRAFNLIEEGEAETATAYLDRLLDLQPNDAQAYLGKLIIEKGVHNKKELIDYYKELFNDEQDEINRVSLSEKDRDHINSICKKYSVPFYLDTDVIDSLYKTFDFSYLSSTPSIERQKDNIENEFTNNLKLSRLMSNADKQLKKEFNDIKNSYQKKVLDAKKLDEEKEAKIREKYRDFVKEKDEEVIKLHEEAIQKKESDYEEYTGRIADATSINQLNDIKSRFLLMEDYKDAKLHIKECDEKIAELERILKEEKEVANQKRKKMTVMALAAAAVMIAVLCIYQFVIIPENKYKSGLVYLENGDYEKAISTYQEIANYKDSDKQLQKALIQKGKALINDKNYQKAVEVLATIADEPDAQEAFNEAKYGLGIQFIEDKKYNDAIEIFDTMADYKDASTKKMQAIYEKAISLREDKKFDEAIKLFDQIIDYEDASNQKAITEQNKKDNSVSVPRITGKAIDDVKNTLDKLGLKYRVTEKESQNDKPGLVVGVSPAEGTVLYRGSEIALTITRGLSKYDDYHGDGNRSVLYQVNVTPSVKQIIMRYSPHITTSNKTSEMAKTGVPYNVYETVYNEGYNWIRTDNNIWFATDTGWVEKDQYCTNRGDYTTVKGWIKHPEGSGVYDRPVENANERKWVERLDYGSEITIYYRFRTNEHYWYKIGANKWIKEVYGEKVAYY